MAAPPPPAPPGYGPPGAYNAPPGMQQPQGMGMMAPPPDIPPGCPPGLEYLAMIDNLIIKQDIELLEAVLGFETNNKYKALNSQGQQIYYLMEETGCMERQFCGKNRGFTIHVTVGNQQEVMRIVRDLKTGCMERQFCGKNRGFTIHVTVGNQQEVMRIVRDLKVCAIYPCCASPGNCCSHQVSIEAPVGTNIGYVRQMCMCVKPKLALYNGEEEMIGILTGPMCVCNSPCMGDVEFPITDPQSGQEIGKCAKKWSGLGMEMFTDADTFSVSFPTDLDVKTKALFFGALMLLDFMYFEKSS